MPSGSGWMLSPPASSFLLPFLLWWRKGGPCPTPVLIYPLHFNPIYSSFLWDLIKECFSSVSLTFEPLLSPLHEYLNIQLTTILKKFCLTSVSLCIINQLDRMPSVTLFANQQIDSDAFLWNNQESRDAGRWQAPWNWHVLLCSLGSRRHIHLLRITRRGMRIVGCRRSMRK